MPKSAVVQAIMPLQDIDIEIYKIEKQITETSMSLVSFEQKLNSAKGLLEEHKSKTKELKMFTHQKELELNTTEEKIKQLNLKSYQVKKNEEFQMIMKELEQNKREKSQLEDTILELYEKIEQMEKIREQKEKDVERANKEFMEVKKKVEGELARLNKKMQELNHKREEFARNIDPPDLLECYQRVLKTKPNRVVLSKAIKIDEDTQICAQCNYQITVQDFNLLILGKDIIYCKNCSCILYYM
jgi:hypothetical protein